MTHPITPYAKSAYATGWAASGGPMTDRVRAGCIAAIEWAIEHSDEPDVIEATLKLGSLEGVWASIYDRRDRLYNDNVDTTLSAWKTFVSGLDIKSIVQAVRHQARVAEATSVDKTTAEYAATIILAQLMGLMATANWLKLRNAVENAISSGLAEGQAGAMALLADKIGAVGFSFDKAFDDAKKAYADNPYLQSVNNWIGSLMDAVAKATGKTIAKSIADGDDPEATNDAADEAISNPEQPTTYIIDQLTHLGISAGILWWLRSNGVANIWYITAGDERVCAQCDDAEANSPYYIQDVPTPPLHSRCRCSIYTDDPMSGDLIASYLGD